MTIQDAGKQILSGNPQSFYVFCGSDYGVKQKYLRLIYQKYGEYVECDTVDAILNRFKAKALFPEKDRLYIVRYDTSFLSTVSDTTQQFIANLDIHGTIVCIYQDSNATSTCMKFLDSYAVEFNPVHSLLIQKYLNSDFPNLDDSIIKNVTESASGYSNAYIICQCIGQCSKQDAFDSSTIKQVFGCKSTSDDHNIRIGLASKNFAFTMQNIDSYDGDLHSILYTILSTMLELDRVLCNRFYKSEYRKFANNWTKYDIYNMFSQTYQKILDSRDYNLNIYDTLVYLISMIQFQAIPNVKYFECEV